MRNLRKKAVCMLNLIVSFLFPIVGIVFYFMYKEKNENAKWCLWVSLLSVCLLGLGGIL